MLLRQRQAVSHPYLLENFFRAVLEPGYLRECIKELSKVEGQTPVYLQIGNWADRHRLSESDEPSQGVAAVPPHLQPFGKSSFGHKFKMARLLTLALSEAILSEATCGICETEGIEKPVATKKVHRTGFFFFFFPCFCSFPFPTFIIQEIGAEF